MTIGYWIIEAFSRSGHAVEYKTQEKWHSLSWKSYTLKVINAFQFIEKHLPFNSNQHVGLMASTSWQWAAIDLAILGSQRVCVPMYPNLSDEDLTYTINQSDVTLLFAESNLHLNQIERIRKNLIREVKIISIQDIDFDSEPSKEVQEAFFAHCLALKPEDIATIVYTSGTTGKPKGAVLKHAAIISEITESFPLFGVKPTYKSLTFLPFAHVLGRIEHWGSCYMGHTIAYAESIEKLKKNLLEVQPDFIIAVPRIFEKVYASIMTQMETQVIKNKLFNQALATAKQIQFYRETKQSIPWSLLIQYETYNQLIFAKIRKAFGGKLQFAVSGGAPLSQLLTEFFLGCGIPILEGYGLTETCAAITVNQLSIAKTGTVGLPIGDVEIQFAEDQEILVKSKKCLSEYYKDPASTKDVIKNGFFATGDIGHFTENGFLKITDRKKDLIKTAGGKYVAPQKLEGLLKQEPLISQVLIHGDQKKFVSALISIEEISIKSWASSQMINYTDITELYQNPALRIRIQKVIQSTNSSLASYESIKKFEIVSDSWTVENGCLTQSLKVKRKIVEEKYKNLIDEMYE